MTDESQAQTTHPLFRDPTPPPWHVVSFADGFVIMDAPPAAGRHVCKLVGGNAIADSHFIITAVNSHADLVAAAEAALAAMKRMKRGEWIKEPEFTDATSMLESALAKEKGKT